MFKLSHLVLSLPLVLLLPTLACAEETPSENAAKRTNDSVRAVKKGMNRVGEAVCMEGDLKCGAKKVGHRIEEAKDATVDGAKAVKAKLD